MNKPCIVLDTNIFLVSLAPRYKYHWIYQYILESKFKLCLTTDILLEYEEIVSQRYRIKRIDGMFNYLLLLPNVSFYTPSFRWYFDLKSGNVLFEIARGGKISYEESGEVLEMY